MTQVETDVLIVGAGGAGLAAACAAAESGAQVVVLEKNPRIGGTTSLSVGSITASGTAWQRRRGIVDTPDEHFRDMDLFLGILDSRDNLELRRVLVDNVNEALDWLGGIGLSFFGPMPEPPHSKPRMHTVLPNSRAYPYYLGREARRLGVRIDVGVRAEFLIRVGDRVAGVRAKTDGQLVTYTARRAVILASGDISSARDLKQQLRADLADVDAINPASTGDGQRMGLEVGGSLASGDLMRGPTLRFRAPPRETFLRRLPPTRLLTRCMQFALEYLPTWMFRPFIMSFMTSSMSPEPALFKAGAILVNREGRCFTDELGQPGPDVAKQTDKSAWIIFDDRIAHQFSGWPNFISTAPGLAYAYLGDYRRTRKDLYARADTLEDLAARLELPELVASVVKHNAALPSDGSRQRLDRGPFHALGPVSAWIVVADVGLAVNTRHQVLGANNAPVPGLYAVGSAGQSGVLLAGHGHHIGWAVTSGRRAGRFASQARDAERVDKQG